LVFIWESALLKADVTTLGHLIKWIKSGVKNGVNSGVMFFLSSDPLSANIGVASIFAAGCTL